MKVIKTIYCLLNLLIDEVSIKQARCYESFENTLFLVKIILKNVHESSSIGYGPESFSNFLNVKVTKSYISTRKSNIIHQLNGFFR